MTEGRRRPAATARRRDAGRRPHPASDPCDAVRGAPGELHRPVRPAAGADPKHQLDITEIALAPSPTTSSPTSGPRASRTAGTWRRPASSWSSRPPCSTSRPRGCCPPSRSRTPRTWRCSRPATCCSPGCCSTGPSRRSRPRSRSGWRPAGRMHAARGLARPAPGRPAARAGLRHHARAARRDRRPGHGAARPAPTVGSTTCTRRRSACASRPTLLVSRLRRERVCHLPRPGRRRRLHAWWSSARFLALLELFREVGGRLRAGRGAGRAHRPVDRERRRATSRSSDEFDDDDSPHDGDEPRAMRAHGRSAPREHESPVTEHRADAETDEPLEDAVRGEDQLGASTSPLPGRCPAALEGVLMVVDEPVERRCPSPPRWCCRASDVARLLVELAAEYAAQQRGFELREVAGGWRIYSRAELAPVVRAVPARRPEGAAHPGRAGDPRRHRLPAAGHRARASPRSAASTSTASCVRCSPAGLVNEVGTDADHRRHPLRHHRRPSSSGWACSSLDELPALAPYLPEVDVLDEIAEGGRA